MLAIFLSVIITGTAIWVYLDATRNKIGKIANTGGMFNMSAGAWGTVTLLLWIVGFPAYLIKRSSLITLASKQPIEVGGRAVKSVVLAIVGGASIAFSAASYMSGSILPSCNAPETISLAEQMIRNAPVIKLNGIQVKGISLPAEKSYDASANKRTCRAILTHALGEESIQYTVEWHDKAKGLISVEILAE